MPSETLSNEIEAQRQSFYEELKPHNLAPLWEVLHGLVTPTPTTPAVPAKWSYGPARDYLLRAGDLISAEEAERRVLILENPAMPGQSRITRTLYAGLQLILPGEAAPVHRHTQSALRFVMQGSGAFTAVNGEKAVMQRFDLVLTPSLYWHDHGNQTDEPMIWLDGLDIPLIQSLDASFAEGMGSGDGSNVQAEVRPAGDTVARYGSNMRPVANTTAAVTEGPQPLFHYPYSEWRASLAKTAAASAPDPHFGVRMEFINPATAGSVMATISAFAQLIPEAMATKPVQSTDGAIYVVCEGAGTAWIDDHEYTLAEDDIFVVPAWSTCRFEASAELVLFSFSDKAVQEKLNLWREARH